MPGPLAHRNGGKAGPLRPPPLRRMPTPPPPADHASALPPEVVRALRLVAAELRSMPRDCARDREELVHWHGRLARRLDAVVASKAWAAAPVAPLAPSKAVVVAPSVADVPLVIPPVPVAPKRVAALDQVLRDIPRPLPARSAPATHWRPRSVDAGFRRRAEAAGQLRFAEWVSGPRT